ncbi:hypothetical protein [Ramlibacter sp.]|uniref:hypothetical protein n=1 Tax=Ramlibacter sp. TaxID=1917967 RepID=UPI003D149283
MNHAESDGELSVNVPELGDWRLMLVGWATGSDGKARVSEILCARHNMTTRSMSATQTEDQRCGAEGGASADPG